MAAIILWAIVGGFLSGVFIRSFVLLSWPFAACIALAAIAALLYAAIDMRKRNILIIAAVACMAFAAGIARMESAARVGDDHLSPRVGTKVVLEGAVSDEPDLREKSTRISVRAHSLIVGSTTIPVSAGVLVIAPPHANVAYGDAVHAEGTLRLPEPFDAGIGRVFDYPLYLAKDGILYELAFARIEATGENDANPIKAAALSFKHAYLSGLRQVLPEPEAGLAGGITVGDKRSIGSELSQVFQRVSLIHMVVLSGYNITVVINAAGTFLSLTPRFVQFGGSAFVVLFFVLMAGGASSAVRAGTMALIAMFARATGRTYLAARILGVVACAMVLWNPFTLAFDPGFQLSALATLGLILFTPLFAERLPWLTARLGIREIVASTLGTQLAVLPLLLYQNGNLSLVALPANLLALLPVPFAMSASALAAAGGMLFGSYAAPLGFPAYALLAYIIEVARFFDSVPFASVSVPAFSAWWMCAAYALLFGGLLLYKKKKPGTRPGNAS